MKLVEKYNPKALISCSLVLAYLILMTLLEDTILNLLIGPSYMDNYIHINKSYDFFIWLIPTQIFIAYIFRFAKIKELKKQLILFSLGLWLFFFGFIFF